MLITEPQHILKFWLCDRIGYIPTHEFVCFGNFDEAEKDIISVVGYDGWSENMVEMHVAGVPGTYWLNKHFLYKAFEFPFISHDLKIVTARVSTGNAEAMRLNKKLGFKEQCRIKGGADDGDLVIFTMYKSDCKWLGMDIRFEEAA